MSRILLDLPDEDLVKLTNHARGYSSRAALVREIIEEWLAQQGDLEDHAFGLLKDHPIDALEYQRKRREEW